MDKFIPTKAWAIDVKKACELLIEKRYSLTKEEQKLNFICCPFDGIGYKYHEKGIDACPWIVFTEFTCAGTDTISNRPKIREYQTYTDEESILRLQGWIRRCDNIIKEEDLGNNSSMG